MVVHTYFILLVFIHFICPTAITLLVWKLVFTKFGMHRKIFKKSAHNTRFLNIPPIAFVCLSTTICIKAISTTIT